MWKCRVIHSQHFLYSLFFMHFKFFDFSLYFRSCNTTGWLNLSSISCNRSCLHKQAHHTLVMHTHTIGYLLQMPMWYDVMASNFFVCIAFFFIFIFLLLFLLLTTSSYKTNALTESWMVGLSCWWLGHLCWGQQCTCKYTSQHHTFPEKFPAWGFGRGIWQETS